MTVDCYKILTYEDYNKLVAENNLLKEEKKELEDEITRLYNVMIGNRETHGMNLESDIEEL